MRRVIVPLRRSAQLPVGATPMHATGAAFCASTAGLTDLRDTLDTGGTRAVLTLQGTF